MDFNSSHPNGFLALGFSIFNYLSFLLLIAMHNPSNLTVLIEISAGIFHMKNKPCLTKINIGLSK